MADLLELPTNPPYRYGFGEGSIIGTLTPTLGYPQAEPARVCKPVPFTNRKVSLMTSGQDGT
jgi:hypothetical protein